MKAGDTVKDSVTGETWTLAFYDAAADEASWCGWPEGLVPKASARLSVVWSCSDQYSLDMLREWASKNAGDVRSRAARRLLASEVPPEHDAEVEALVAEIGDAWASNFAGDAVTESIRRAVQAGRELADASWRKKTPGWWAQYWADRAGEAKEDAGKQVATAKAEGYREGLAAGERKALDNASHFAALGVLTATPQEAVCAAFPQEIAAAKAAGAREEREACATIALGWNGPENTYENAPVVSNVCRAIAADIRRRGNAP